MIKINKAFSLIELMVVIAIVALLAAIAVPAYSVYTTKTKIASVLPLMSNLKAAAADYYNKHGVWPSTIADLGVSTADSLDTNVITSFGICPTGCFGAVADFDYAGEFGYFVRLDPTQLSLPTTASNPTLVFDAVETNGIISWYCSTDSITFDITHNILATYLPSGCLSPDA